VKTFDFDRLWRVADRARSQPRLDREDVALIRDEAPRALASFPRVKPPAMIRHPAGFSLSGAPVRTFMKSALLVSGQKALGRRYGGSLFYETVEKELALGIMRSHFHHGYPKGTYCCTYCSLAIYPVLRARAIRYFDCNALAKNLEHVIRGRQWRFKTPPNAAILRWALGDD